MASDRLSGLDASFLHLEHGPAHMHVASTTLFEGPTPSYDELCEHIESRLHLVPRFRQKLRSVPLGQGRPKWIDDPHFNLRYHIRHTALPPPGDEAQLLTLAARVFSQRLDRSKPLWEMWLVDKVEGGRFALVTKSHHALVDGVSGVDITNVLFDTAPDPESVPAREPWTPHPEPSSAQVLTEACWSGRPARPRSSAASGPSSAPRDGSRRPPSTPPRRQAPSPAPASRHRTPPSTSRSAPTAASPRSAPSSVS